MDSGASFTVTITISAGSQSRLAYQERRLRLCAAGGQGAWLMGNIHFLARLLAVMAVHCVVLRLWWLSRCVLGGLLAFGRWLSDGELA